MAASRISLQLGASCQKTYGTQLPVQHLQIGTSALLFKRRLSDLIRHKAKGLK